MKTENKRHFFFKISTLILLMVFVYSCNLFKSTNTQKEDDLIFVGEKTLNIELSLGKIEKYVEIEKQLKSEDVTRNYFVDIDESIYK